jgi:hypothetical protein
MGAIETPEYRPLPWAKAKQPTVQEVRRQERMERLGDMGTIVGVVGGTLGLILTLRALGVLKGRKR